MKGNSLPVLLIGAVCIFAGTAPSEPPTPFLDALLIGVGALNLAFGVIIAVRA